MSKLWTYIATVWMCLAALSCPSKAGSSERIILIEDFGVTVSTKRPFVCTAPISVSVDSETADFFPRAERKLTTYARDISRLLDAYEGTKTRCTNEETRKIKFGLSLRGKHITDATYVSRDLVLGDPHKPTQTLNLSIDLNAAPPPKVPQDLQRAYDQYWKANERLELDTIQQLMDAHYAPAFLLYRNKLNDAFGPMGHMYTAEQAELSRKMDAATKSAMKFGSAYAPFILSFKQGLHFSYDRKASPELAKFLALVAIGDRRGYVGSIRQAENWQDRANSHLTSENAELMKYALQWADESGDADPDVAASEVLAGIQRIRKRETQADDAVKVPDHYDVNRSLNAYLLANCSTPSIVFANLRAGDGSAAFWSSMGNFRAEDEWCVGTVSVSNLKMYIKIGRLTGANCVAKFAGAAECSFHMPIECSIQSRSGGDEQAAVVYSNLLCPLIKVTAGQRIAQLTYVEKSWKVTELKAPSEGNK